MWSDRSSTDYSVWRSPKTAGVVGVVLYRRTIIVDFSGVICYNCKKSKNGQQSSPAMMRKRKV